MSGCGDMSLIEKTTLKLEWIPTTLAKSFVQEIMEQYFIEAKVSTGMVGLDELFSEIGPSIVDTLSLVETGGSTSQKYWREMEEYPHYAQSIYSEAVNHSFEYAIKDIVRIMKYYHLTYVESAGFYQREKMQHYCVEVW